MWTILGTWPLPFRLLGVCDLLQWLSDFCALHQKPHILLKLSPLPHPYPRLGISASVSLKWGLKACVLGELAKGYISGAPEVKHTDRLCWQDCGLCLRNFPTGFT